VRRDLKKLSLDVAQSIILSIHDIKNDPYSIWLANWYKGKG